LAALWRLHDCRGAKKPEYNKQRIPKYFYKDSKPDD